MPYIKSYAQLRDIFRDIPLPAAYVDVDAFDRNIDEVVARAGSKEICVASKSVRCVALLKRIMQRSPRFVRIMAYSLREAVFLSENGFDSILVAYPVYREATVPGLFQSLRKGKHIVLMVDCREHVTHLEALGAAHDVTIPVCIDVDLSYNFVNLHFGVWRSGLHAAEQVLELAREIRACPHLRLDGIMGYEAQIAGVPDRFPSSLVKTTLIGFLKQRSLQEVRAVRAEVVETLKRDGFSLRFVNGGGTGSLETTREESVVTEVTAGSAFYSPTLFDNYRAFRHLPAAGFALEITRHPTENIFTCHGGGYIASGSPGWEKVPQPYLPEGAELLPLEGAGEVQTPVKYSGPEKLQIGDPIFFRHAKAGELCERFADLHLIQGDRIVETVPTYRGQNQCYL